MVKKQNKTVSGAELPKFKYKLTSCASLASYLTSLYLISSPVKFAS